MLVNCYCSLFFIIPFYHCNQTRITVSFHCIYISLYYAFVASGWLMGSMPSLAWTLAWFPIIHKVFTVPGTWQLFKLISHYSPLYFLLLTLSWIYHVSCLRKPSPSISWPHTEKLPLPPLPKAHSELILQGCLWLKKGQWLFSPLIPHAEP